MKGRGIERDSERKKIERKRRFITKIMTRNYEEKLSAEIITGNYHTENVGIIGILAYLKIISL